MPVNELTLLMLGPQVFTYKHDVYSFQLKLRKKIKMNWKTIAWVQFIEMSRLVVWAGYGNTMIASLLGVWGLSRFGSVWKMMEYLI